MATKLLVGENVALAALMPLVVTRIDVALCRSFLAQSTGYLIAFAAARSFVLDFLVGTHVGPPNNGSPEYRNAGECVWSRSPIS